MKHRIFIAINLPEEVKDELEKLQFEFFGLPFKWTKKDNLHITLVFLGYLKNEDLLRVLQLTENAVQKSAPFRVKLKKIVYAPPLKKPPRMIWVEGERSQELNSLRRNLENSFLDAAIPFIKENRDFHPHITLARIRRWEFQKMTEEEIPDIEKEINLSLKVNSIEIMESHLKKGGAEYAVVKSYLLGK